MRIIFLFTLAFFLNSCAVTPRFVIGQTNGVSLTFTPKEGFTTPAPNIEPGRSSGSEEWELGQSENEVYERRARRRRALQGVFYATLAAAAVGGLVYLAAADHSDESSGCPSGECYVSGYYRSSGTYVDGYCRRC